jgi:hypothetical protein
MIFENESRVCFYIGTRLHSEANVLHRVSFDAMRGFFTKCEDCQVGNNIDYRQMPCNEVLGNIIMQISTCICRW